MEGGGGASEVVSSDFKKKTWFSIKPGTLANRKLLDFSKNGRMGGGWRTIFDYTTKDA